MPSPGGWQAATVVNDESPLPVFALQRQSGSFGNADLLGHWTLLDFGYTFCPDICPTTLVTIKALLMRIDASHGMMPQVVFVSVDPARDTPQRLADYVHFFNPAFIGATGDDAALAPLVKHLGVQYQRQDGSDKIYYAVDHSAAIYLIDPAGRLTAVFSWPHDAAAIAADYLRLTGGQALPAGKRLQT